MGALFGFIGLVVFVIGLVFLIVRAIKKESKKVPLILVIVGIVLFIVGMAIPSPKQAETPVEPTETSVVEAEPKEEPVQEQNSEEVAEAPVEETADATEDNSNKTTYMLDADNPTPGISEYVTFNEGTEFEDQSLVFHVEPGIYEVSNIGSYRSQVNVYVDGEKNVTEEGWEEWVVGDEGDAYLVDVGETIEVNVPEGYIIHLDPPAKLSLVQK